MLYGGKVGVDELLDLGDVGAVDVGEQVPLLTVKDLGYQVDQELGLAGDVELLCDRGHLVYVRLWDIHSHCPYREEL